MFVSKVSLTNFRNYESCELRLKPGRNILVGENAQGKTNLLEAIELLATGKSNRAQQDIDLIRWQTEFMKSELEFTAGNSQESLRLQLAKPAPQKGVTSTRLEKHVYVNGVTQKNMHDLAGRLLVVSFASHDLNLLRGGPKFRRDWLDDLILKLRPAFGSSVSDYKKSIAQRNRLLKSIFERGKVTVSDQDQLLVWDQQVARFGARIIKQRLTTLMELLPLAEVNQSRISREMESLSINYFFKSPEQGGDNFQQDDEEESGGDRSVESTGPLTASELGAMDEVEIAKTLMRLLKERRAHEIRRKQTTVGPHRDDLVFCLNGADAVNFASQGQQRSIVLSLKLAELSLVRAAVKEEPVLLLDDVLAELDEFRQGLLMSVVHDGMQTIITTTHVSGFDARWLDGAAIFNVAKGIIASADESELASC